MGPAALKALMAYGAAVLDTRSPEGLSDLSQRLAVLAPDRDQLVLLLVDDANTSLPAAHAVQQHGYRSVVLVSPEPGAAAPHPGARVPDQTPG